MAIVTLTANETGANSLSDINANFADLDTTKADLASPALTGNPTAPTQTAGDNSTKIATTAYVETAVSTITSESTAAATHSLTTVASQKVLVWAKGSALSSNITTVTLSYNGVSKDTVVVDPSSAGNKSPFALMYTETPGAATANITVTADGTGSLSNVVIMVQKIS